MSDRIGLNVPLLDGNEARYLRECVDDGYVSSVGPFVNRFEEEFAAVVGSRHAIACASGTAALHVALRLSGAEVGTSVAVSTLTFIASANAIVYTGADVLAVDSERRSWNLDGELLHAEVVTRARRGQPLPVAIEVVHVLGHPADLEPVLDLRERFGIAIVEDAAEALGAAYQGGSLAGRSVGTIGTFGCFSFNGNKVITTGGGGMIVTDDRDLAARAKHLTTQAKLTQRGYLHDEVGYNYRLTNMAAALGVAQLERLDSFLATKREIARRYDDALADLPLSLPPRESWADPSLWLYSVLLESGAPPREEVLDRLNAEGIDARPLWAPIHRQQPYRDVARLAGGVADDLYARGISLPSSVGLSGAEQRRVIEALKTAVSDGGSALLSSGAITDVRSGERERRSSRWR